MVELRCVHGEKINLFIALLSFFNLHLGFFRIIRIVEGRKASQPMNLFHSSPIFNFHTAHTWKERRSVRSPETAFFHAYLVD